MIQWMSPANDTNQVTAERVDSLSEIGDNKFWLLKMETITRGTMLIFTAPMVQMKSQGESDWKL